MNLTILQPRTPITICSSPHPSTFFPEFNQCKTKRDLIQLHAKLIKTGRIRDPLASAELIRFSALSDPPHRDLRYALRLFQQMNPPNCFSWNTLIRAYCDTDDSLQSFLLFAQMIHVIKPNRFTFPSVLKSCAKMGRIEEGKQTHCLVLKHGLGKDKFVLTNLVRMYVMCGEMDDAFVLFESNKTIEENDSVVLWNVMVDGFVRIGEIENARKVFDEMPQRSLVSWNTMISGYAQNGMFVEALELFREMQMEGDVAVPNYVTLISVLPAVSRLGALEIGKWVHFFAVRNGIEVDSVLGSALVDMYSKCGSVDEACQLFDSLALSRKNVVTWNSMINGLAIHGRGNEAVRLFVKMRENGVLPNDVTYISVLTACSHAGLVDKGLEIFNQMVVQDQVPRIEHYGCMVDLLGRAGRVQEAEELVLDMVDEPDDVVLKALLGACKKHGNIEIGERVGKRLLEKDPEDGAPYVALSNMYAALSDWDGVKQTRLMMKQNEVKKDPGCSWIEVDGAIHEFVVADDSHARSNEIYTMLEEMNEKLRSAGYKPDTSQVFLRMDDADKEAALQHHSEKIAVAFGLISTTRETTIKVVKNLRICDDCHSTMKLVSRIYRRRIVVRDRKRFHHFENGSCSCMDYW